MGAWAKRVKWRKSGIDLVERLRLEHPDQSLPLAFGAGALAQLGDRTRALEWAAAALTIAPDDPLTLYNVACNYAMLGEVDLSLDLLERWGSRANARTKTWVRNDSDFDLIRDTPRFQKFLEVLD